jgi:hypothetical protein
MIQPVQMQTSKAFNRKPRKENPQSTQSNPDNPIFFAFGLSLRP